MSTLSLTLAQYAPSESVSENLRAMATLVDQAVGAGSQLVVFPEYSHAFGPDFGDEWAASAESLEGEFVAGLTQLSRDRGGIVIVAGMLVASPGDDRPSNTLVAVDETGVMAVAEKIHLYDAFGSHESKWIRPGTLDTPQLFAVGSMKVGMMACYDLRFPEVSRRLADCGADVIVTPAQWVPGPHKAHHFDTLVAARAIETQTFVVAVDHPEPWGIGHSQAVDPRGVNIAKSGPREELLHLTLDGLLLADVRAHNPMAAARRFGVVAL